MYLLFPAHSFDVSSDSGGDRIFAHSERSTDLYRTMRIQPICCSSIEFPDASFQYGRNDDPTDAFESILIISDHLKGWSFLYIYEKIVKKVNFVYSIRNAENNIEKTNVYG